VECDGAAAGTGTEAGRALGRVDVLLVIARGGLAVAAEDECRDVQLPRPRVTRRRADDDTGFAFCTGAGERIDPRVAGAHGEGLRFGRHRVELVPGEEELGQDEQVGTLPGRTAHEIRGGCDVRGDV